MGFIPTGSSLRYGAGSLVRHQPKTPDTSQCTPILFVLNGDQGVSESVALLTGSEGWRLETLASAEGIFRRPPEHVPSCLILEVCLPDHTGLELQKRVAAERPYISIIFLGQKGDVATSVKAMKAGAVDFFTKPCQAEELLSTIRHAHERSRFALACEAEQRLYQTLSHREREVMALLATGLLNKQVGAELGICEKTVKAHRGQIMQKMKAASFADLVKMTMRLGSGSCLETNMPLRTANYASIVAGQLFRGYAMAH